MELKFIAMLYHVPSQLLTVPSSSQNPELYIRLPDKRDDINSSEECLHQVTKELGAHRRLFQCLRLSDSNHQTQN